MAVFTTTYTINCPSCESKRVNKVGMHRGHQRYLCLDCRKKFRAPGYAPGHRVPTEHMGMAIRMFYSGMSYKQIAETMRDTFNIPEPSKATLYEWVRDYTDRAHKEMSKPEYKPKTGSVWVADEMFVKVGGKTMYHWNVMDVKTRFVLASYLSENRDMKAAETVMEMASEAAQSHPSVIKTDGLGSYPQAVNLVFPKTKHTVSQGIRAEINNNLSERLQGTYRDREKTLRGMDSRETGQRYLNGFTLTYNFFREHESLDDRTPAEAAKVKAPYKDWADVVDSGRDGKLKPPPRTEDKAKVMAPTELPAPAAVQAPKAEKAAKDVPKPAPPRASQPKVTVPERAKTPKARKPPWLKKSERRGHL